MSYPINVRLALAHQNAALARMDDENARLRNAGFDLTSAGPPYWDRSTWEAYRAQFGEYPFGPGNKPPQIQEAPPWVKEICGVRLTPAERMGQ
jgi:hypothetical protein